MPTAIPEVSTATYSIPEAHLHELEAKLQKLVKKSAKLSMGGVSYSVDRDNPEDRVISQRRAIAHRLGEEPQVEQTFRRYFTVTITGTIPRLAGWDFLATLDHMEVDGEKANILRVVPGFDGVIPTAFRTATPENCDHCHKAIRTRKNTFIVRNAETGEFKQVGRNCTQDFLGGLDPHEVGKMLELVRLANDAAGSDFEGGLGGGSDKDMGFGFETFLATVNAVIRLEGWLSRGKARIEDRLEMATANRALYALTPPRGGGQARADWEKFVEELAVGPEDLEVAEAAIDMVRDTIDFQTEDNDYRRNLRIAFGQDVVYNKLAGIVASGVSFYLREVQKLKEAEGLRQATSTEFIGTVGEKVSLENVQLVFIRRLEGQFGGYDLAKFVTADGKAVTVFGQVEGAVGEFGSLVGKVSKHDSYQGKPSTQVKGRTLFTSTARQAELDALKAEQKAAKKAQKAAEKAALKAAEETK
jgi:hypothetical protein